MSEIRSIERTEPRRSIGTMKDLNCLNSFNQPSLQSNESTPSIWSSSPYYNSKQNNKICTAHANRIQTGHAKLWRERVNVLNSGSFTRGSWLCSWLPKIGLFPPIFPLISLIFALWTLIHYFGPLLLAPTLVKQNPHCINQRVSFIFSYPCSKAVFFSHVYSPLFHFFYKPFLYPDIVFTLS